jgi:hypothetical protein
VFCRAEDEGVRGSGARIGAGVVVSRKGEAA